MLLEDLAVGWVLSKLFGKSDAPAQSPGVFFPPNGTTAPPNGTTAPPATTAPPQFPAQVPVPASAPPGPTATPATPSGNVPPAGFKRAVEMFVVSPQLAQQGSALISGMGPQVGAMALSALQAQFPKGWQRAKSATAQEQAFAKSLLPNWHDGKTTFTGSTLTNARAWLYTKHPGAQPPVQQQQPPAAAPPATTAPPAAAPPDFPAGVPVPATAPATPTVTPGTVKQPDGTTVTTRPDGSKVTTLPEVLITADAPPAGSKPVNQVTAVRKGEGLANVARRLGQPATAASAKVLQAANVPGPDGVYTAQPLDKGGLKRKGRAGGLQPGDRLFVPPQWGPVNASAL